MTEDVARLVHDMRERASLVNSFVADYKSSYKSSLMPFEAVGKMHFQRPDKMRSDTLVNGNSIVSIRNGSIVQRYSLQGNEVWKYDLKDLPQTEPMNSGIANIADPFFAVDESTLEYDGINDTEGTKRHVFIAKLKGYEKEGLLDTRKGYSLRYQPKASEARLRLFIDPDTCLLLGLIGIDREDSILFQSSYTLSEVDLPIDESLFRIAESMSGYKMIDIKDILISAMNPDYADQPPSPN